MPDYKPPDSSGGRKPNRKTLPIVCGILIALIAAAAVIAGSPFVRNAIALAALSPSSYYKMTEAAGLASETNRAVTAVKQASGYLNPGPGEGNAAQLTARISFADGLPPLSLPLPDISVNAVFSFTEGLAKTDVSAQAGLIRLKALGYLNLSEGLAYLGFPNLTSSFLKYASSPKTLTLPGGGSITVDLRGTAAEEWKSLFQKLAGILSSSADSVILDKNRTAESAGISCKCTRITVTFEPEAQCDILEALTNEPALKNDRDGEPFNRAAYLKEAETLTMTVWVDSHGRIIGREFRQASDAQPALFWLVVRDKDQYGFTLRSSGALLDEFSISGSAVRTQDGLNGSLNVHDGTAVRFSNLKAPDKNTKQLLGTFEIQSPNGKLASVRCDKDDLTQLISVVQTRNGSELLTAEIALKSAPFVAFALPDETAVKIYDFSDGISGFLKETGLFDLFGGLF